MSVTSIIQALLLDSLKASIPPSDMKNPALYPAVIEPWLPTVEI